MSRRHRDAEQPLPPRQEVRAHAHGERHRIHVELAALANEVSGGLDPDDATEPGVAWKPEHPRDAEVERQKFDKRNRSRRHWKTKMWKRRTKLRQQRAKEMRLAPE